MADADAPKPLNPKAFTRNPTRGYVPSSAAWLGAAGAVLDGKPFFTWLRIPEMVRDPQVRFAERMWCAPFRRVTFAVKAESKAVAAFVNSSLHRFWARSLPLLLPKYFRYGYAPGGAEFCRRRGMVRLDRVRAVQPPDARPLVWAGGAAKGQPAGFTLPGAGRVLPPHAFWYAGTQELGPAYDMPPLAGIFVPWVEKNSRNGATDLRRLAWRKAAGSGGVVRYTPGVTNCGTDENPQYRDNQDLAREVADYYESFGVVILSNEVHPGIPGKFAWEFEPPQAKAEGLGGINENVKDLDNEMLRGAGIPPEVLEASEVGSGWSGRMIPLMGFFGEIDKHAGLLVEAADNGWLKHAVAVNFGRAAWYEVEPVPLVDQLQQSAQGGAGGGEGPNPVPEMMGRGGGAGAGLRPDDPRRDRPASLSDGRGSPVPREVRRRVAKLLAKRARQAARELSDGRPPREGLVPKTGDPQHPGRWVRPEEGGAAKADSRARRIVKRLRGLPAAAVSKARAKVASAYGKLSARYGTGYARLIVAAGVAALPVPLPGASFAAAAPVLAVAELHRRLARRNRPAPADADPQTVRAGSRWFLGRVLGRARAAVMLSDGRGGESDGRHAPKGGITIGGTTYKGGQFIPGDVIAAATPEERAALDADDPGKNSGADAAPDRKAGRRPRTPPPRFATTPTGRVLVGADVQRWAEGHNEPEVATAVGGAALVDNEPVDVEVRRRGKLVAGIELKTMVANAHRQIHMSAGAKRRKRAWRRAHRVPLHTVVIDDTAAYNAAGPGRHDLSKRRVFYRRGVGSFKVDQMHEVEGGIRGLKRLLATPTRRLPPGAWKAKPGGAVRRRNDPGPPAGADNPTAPPANTPMTGGPHAATAAAWVERGGAALPAETKAKYTADLVHVLSRMPDAAREAAVKAVEHPGHGRTPRDGGPVFHPDSEAVNAACGEATGRRERGVVGFVRQAASGAVDIHLDGTDDPDARGTYAHELWHAVDSDETYSSDKAWKAAYKADILKGRHLLSRYAMTSPSEGFAEFGRVLQEKGNSYMRVAFPNCWKFLEAKGLDE